MDDFRVTDKPLTLLFSAARDFRITTVTTDMGVTPTVTGHDLRTLSWAIFTAKVQIR